MAQAQIDVARLLRQVPPPYAPSPAHQTYAPQMVPQPHDIEHTTSDEESEYPSTSDIQVTIHDKGIEPDTALDRICTLVLWFACVAYGTLEEGEDGKKRLKNKESSIPVLGIDIVDTIVRGNLIVFGRDRCPSHLTMITIRDHNRLRTEKARAILKIANTPSQASLQVLMLKGTEDDVSYSFGYPNLFQGRGPGKLGALWRKAFQDGWIIQNGHRPKKYIQWAELIENGVFFFDAVAFDYPGDLFQEIFRWLVMANAPKFEFCILVISLNHGQLTVTKQDNILNAVSTLLFLWRGIGPQTSQVLILKGNVQSSQSTQKALETLVRATLTGPDIRLENKTGLLIVRYGLRKQEPIDEALRDLVAKSNSQKSVGPVVSYYQELCRAMQRAFTWGPRHATTGQEHVRNIFVKMTQVVGGRAVEVSEEEEEEAGMHSTTTTSHVEVSANPKTSKRQRQKKHGKEPMEAMEAMED